MIYWRGSDRPEVRADFILKLHREGQRFPRRQEAESAYVDSRTALVTHEEARDMPFFNNTNLPAQRPREPEVCLCLFVSPFRGARLGRRRGG